MFSYNLLKLRTSNTRRIACFFPANSLAIHTRASNFDIEKDLNSKTIIQDGFKDMIKQVEHFQITASNVEKSIEFYTKALGFKVLRKFKVKMNPYGTYGAYLILGNTIIEIINAIPSTKAYEYQEGEDWRRRMRSNVGLRQIGFTVENLDEEVERLKSLGVKMIQPPLKRTPDSYEYDIIEPVNEHWKKVKESKKGIRIAMFYDPDGVVLEFIEGR